MASTGADDTIRLWNAESGQSLGSPLAGHEGNVASLAFHPEGQILASGGADNQIFLWDLETGQPLKPPLSGHIGLVRALAFSPEEEILASAGHDETVRLWDVDPDSWQERACQKANCNLTLEEWGQFFGEEPYRPTCPDLPAATE